MEQENKTTTKDKKTRRQHTQLLLYFLKGSKHLFAGSIIASLFYALCDMVDPQIFRAAIDNAIGGKEPDFPKFVTDFVDRLGGFEYLGKNLWIMALAVVFVAVIRAISGYLQRVLNNKGAETLVRRMRDSMFSHIEHLPYEWHMKNHTGDIIQRCTSDVEMVRQFVAEQLVSVVRISIMIILSLFFMFSMNVGLTFIAIIPIPFILAYVLIFRKEMERGFRECDEMEGKVSARIQENLTGMRVVRAFAQEAKEKDRFIEQNNHYNSLWVRLAGIMARFFTTQHILSMVQILVVLIAGCVFCVNGKITAGEYVAFISYNSMLSFPIRRLGRMISEMSKAGVCLDRIGHVMHEPVEQDAPGSVEAPMDGDIVFDHVSFAYEGSSEVLHDVSFTIPAGSTLGILGGTGSGKSTLMLLMDKMYTLPEGCGTISIGGTDIRGIKTQHLRKNISMVLQEPFLFSRTIQENIGISSRSLTREDVKEAAKAACLDEAVESFSKGYDTFVGERGVTLSGGQKQRAAIARALIANAPIMVLDDSLSAVDTETDAKVRRALEERFGSATIILISHRITTLSKADKVIVLDNGRIAEEGTPDELRTAGGIYNRIYDIQSGLDETHPGAGKEAGHEND
ncbi:MAG: ABC transporter ATP-binding protein/permease [Clostridia bacterium]|nr:ABC transporter ATP-binding protein/permease [Clostridia bacterium]